MIFDNVIHGQSVEMRFKIASPRLRVDSIRLRIAPCSIFVHTHMVQSVVADPSDGGLMISMNRLCDFRFFFKREGRDVIFKKLGVLCRARYFFLRLDYLVTILVLLLMSGTRLHFNSTR